MTRLIPYKLDEVPVSQFYGGQSSDEAIGTSSSFSYSRALDHRSNPSQLSVLPGPRPIGAGVIQDLILNIVQVNSGSRYCLGDQGYLYKIDTSNVLTYLGKLPTGSDGLAYLSSNNSLYYATQTDLRRLSPFGLDATYGPSKSIDTAAYRTGGVATGNTYTVPKSSTAIESEYCSFQPDIEPFYSIKVNVVTLGAGDLSIFLHEGVNTSKAVVTIPNANLVVGMNEFVFSSQIRALVKPDARTYHFHLVSTLSGTTVATATSGNLNTADFELWAYRFVQPRNGFHPMVQFEQFICIGNGRYLSVWEPLSDSDPPNNEFQRHRLTFPDGFEVCGLAVTDEFLVIACEKYATDGTKDFQEGKLFTWDGTAQTYNQVIDVSGGSPSGIRSHENYPYFTVNGTLCAWSGGKNIVKVRTIANTNTVYSGVVDNTRVYPNMMDVRNGMLHLGYPSVTNNTAIEHGVYVWGSLDKNYAASFNYGYVPSSMQTTPTGSALQIGCVRNFGDEMYTSWKDANGNYGLDIVDNLCSPAPVFKFRTRRFDAGAAYRDKQAVKMSVTTAAIPAGTTITPVHKIDGGADQTHSAMATGDTENITTIQQGIFRRILIGFDGTCSGTATPLIYCNTLQYNPLVDRSSL